MQLVELIGKGQEILKYIAEKEPRKHDLRYRWSSRTVWKQISRLQKQGLVIWQDDKYQGTDSGLYNLARSLRSRAEVKRILKIATRKFPNGATVRVFGPVVTLRQPNVKEMLMRNLSMKNVFVFCRTNAERQPMWTFVTTRGPEDLRIYQRVHGKWCRLHIPQQPSAHREPP